MEILCPSCNKANQSDPCQRCGCELTALFAVSQAAVAELRTAAHCLRTQSPEAAHEAAVRSWELRHTPEAARLGFLASLALEDFATAGYWLQRSA